MCLRLAIGQLSTLVYKESASYGIHPAKTQRNPLNAYSSSGSPSRSTRSYSVKEPFSGKENPMLKTILMLGLAALATAAEPDPKVMSYTLPADLKWTGTGGNRTAILFGDPAKPGMYGILVKWLPGQMSRPHTHPQARYITVIKGTWWLGWGEKYDPASTFPAKEGTFVVHHANQVHYDGAKDEECIIEIVGMGPAESVQLNPAAKK
jgi:quercetin dioxygenase-like cupin family protein